MATSAPKSPKTPHALFWTLLGIALLAIGLAAAWRVANGAELEAKGKEWSLKVNEAANTLDEARKQLEDEAKRLKDEARRREAYWSAQLASARAACPKASEVPASPPEPPDTLAVGHSEKALAEVAKTTEGARAAARDIGRIKVPGF